MGTTTGMANRNGALLLYNIAMVQEDMGDHDGARNSLEQCIRIRESVGLLNTTELDEECPATMEGSLLEPSADFFVEEVSRQIGSAAHVNKSLSTPVEEFPGIDLDDCDE